MTNEQWIGERLREWRKASGLTTAEMARQLNTHESTIKDLEDDDSDCYPGTELRQRIEALIAPTPDHEQMIDAAVAAIRAGLEQGCTIVQIVRPATAERGRVVVTLGDTEDAPDPEWRIEP